MISETCENFQHNECRRLDCECSCHVETSSGRAVIELGWLISRAMDSESAKADAQEYLAEIEGVLDLTHQALERIAHLDETEGAGNVGYAMEIARTALAHCEPCDAFFPMGAIVGDATQVRRSICVCGRSRRAHEGWPARLALRPLR